MVGPRAVARRGAPPGAAADPPVTPHHRGDRPAAAERGQAARHPGRARPPREPPSGSRPAGRVIGGADHGGWRRGPPPAGPARAFGNARTGWRGRSGGAPNPGWPSSTAPSSGRTGRPPAPKGGPDAGGGRSGSRPWPFPGRLRRQGARARRRAPTPAAERAVAFAPTPGPAAEPPEAEGLLAHPPGTPLRTVADRGCPSHARREAIRDLGSTPAIPTRKNEAPVRCRGRIHRRGDRVERLWPRLGGWRCVATRCEKTAASFLGVPSLAAAFDRIKR